MPIAAAVVILTALFFASRIADGWTDHNRAAPCYTLNFEAVQACTMEF